MGIIIQRPALPESKDLTVKIMPLKISEDRKKVQLSHVLSALQYARENGANIINMSFGFSESSLELHRLIQEMEEEGIFFIAAAGNHAGEKKYYPAAYDEVFSVGSADITGTPKDRSNYGDWVNAFFPGDFLSTIPKGQYGISGGTSQASAFATSFAAEYLLQNPGARSVDIQKHLYSVSREYLERFEDYFTGISRYEWLTYSQVGLLLMREAGDTPAVVEVL